MNFWMYAALTVSMLFSVGSLLGETKVLAFSGSMRMGSSNQRLVADAARMATEMGAKVTVINLRDYPIAFFDEDLEKNLGMPPKARDLRKMMLNSDVIFISTPEYNGSVTPVLKNALDWMSRDEEGKPSRTAYQGKRFLLLSASPGQEGGTRGLQNLKSIVEEVGGNVVVGTLAVPNVFNAFNSSGQLKDAAQNKALQELVQKAIAPKS